MEETTQPVSEATEMWYMSPEASGGCVTIASIVLIQKMQLYMNNINILSNNLQNCPTYPFVNTECLQCLRNVLSEIGASVVFR